MESISVNKQFKDYQKNGGTMNFKEFVDKHNRRKNAMGDMEVDSMFKNAMGDDMFGQAPIVEFKPTIKKPVKQFRNGMGGSSMGNKNDDNMTFGINNYVIIGTAVIIVGAIGLNYYLKHKK